MSVIVEVSGNVGDSLDDVRDGDILPTQRVREQAYALGMIYKSGKRHSNAKYLVPRDLPGSDKLRNPLLDRCCHCPGVRDIPHAMLAQGIAMKVRQNHHRRVLGKAHTDEVTMLSV